MKTDSLIAELTMQAGPVKSLPHLRICAEWVCVTVLSLVIISRLYGLRADLSQRLAEPLFATELLLNAMLILTAGCAATAFSYPDRAKAPLLKWMLVAAFLGYSALTLITTFSAPVLLSEHGADARSHGSACFVCILSFAAVPALWMFWRLKQLASTKPMIAGGAALMMAVATGCLGVRLVETEIVPTGIIFWHYLPLIALSTIGLVLGKKIFRW